MPVILIVAGHNGAGKNAHLYSMCGPKFYNMKISQDIRRDTLAQNDATASLAEAEAGSVGEL